MNTNIKLKINLMYYGMSIHPDAIERLPQGKFGNLVYRDYPTTGGIILKINNLYVNAVINYNSFYELNYIGNSFYLKFHETTIPVDKILSPPRFALDNLKISTGEPARNMVMTHSDRTRISPITGCSNTCRFCDLPGLVYHIYEINELKESFDLALNDDLLQPAHILISGGTPRSDKESYDKLNKIYQYFPEHYKNFDFDVMLSPRGYKNNDISTKGIIDFLIFLKDCGIKGISVNLELFSPQIRKEIIPEKEAIGLDNYFSFIEKSIEIFGEGMIRSLLLIGLEDQTSTLKGVEELAKRKCLPVLSPFIPGTGTFLSQTPPPQPDYQFDVLHAAKEICSKYNVALGPICRKCSHNVIQ